MENELDLRKLVKTKYGFDVESIKRITGYDDLNFIVRCKDDEVEKKFILKVTNVADSSIQGLVESLIEVLVHLSSLHFPSPVPALTKDNKYVECINTDAGIRKVVLLTYIEGIELKSLKVEKTSFMNLCRELGTFCGELDTQLQKLKQKPEVLIRPGAIWSLGNIHLLRGRSNIISDPEIKEICKSTINLLSEYFTAESRTRLTTGIIHGDFAMDNVLYKETVENSYSVAAVIDFFDVSISFYASEIACLIASVMHEAAKFKHDPLEAAKITLVGFKSKFTLNKFDLDFLYHGVLGRFCVLRILCGEDVSKVDVADHMNTVLSIVDSLLKSMNKAGKEYWDRQIFNFET